MSPEDTDVFLILWVDTRSTASFLVRLGSMKLVSCHHVLSHTVLCRGTVFMTPYIYTGHEVTVALSAFLCSFILHFTLHALYWHCFSILLTSLPSGYIIMTLSWRRSCVVSRRLLIQVWHLDSLTKAVTFLTEAGFLLHNLPKDTASLGTPSIYRTEMWNENRKWPEK